MMRLKLILSFLLLSLFVTANAAAQKEKLVFAVDVIRHGDRTPIDALPAAPHEWPQGLGQLTPIGMQQEFQLGAVFHKRYIEENHLLPEHYSKETVHVESTDVERTLMSAESLLMGLYPLGTGPTVVLGKFALPAGYQPIPIHTRNIEETENRKALLEKYVYTQPLYQQYSAKLQPNFARWSQLTGFKVNTLSDLELLSDIFYIDQLYHVPLPAGITETDAKTIIDAGEWAFVTTYKTPEIGDITGRPLLAMIANYLQEASQQKTKLKYFLFSAHDSTIMALASAMRAPCIVGPHYASDLNISLYEAGPENYTVKVTLNDQPLNIPACGGTTCSLSQFITLAQRN